MLVCAMALLSGQCVFGQGKKTVAVIPAQGKSASEKIKDDITGGMEEGVRRSDKYELLPRDESFAKALGEMKLIKSQEVTDEQLMQFGRALDANFVCYALVEKESERLYFVNYRMINVSSGKIARSGSEPVRFGVDGLLRSIDNIAERLFKSNSDGKQKDLPDSVKVEPQYPGGIQKFREYIMRNLEGRNIDIKSDQLRMAFQFIVGKDGYLSDIKIVDNGGSAEAAREVVNILCFCPRWSPATIDGKPVRMSFNLPVVINLTPRPSPTSSSMQRSSSSNWNDW